MGLVLRGQQSDRIFNISRADFALLCECEMKLLVQSLFPKAVRAIGMLFTYTNTLKGASRLPTRLLDMKIILCFMPMMVMENRFELLLMPPMAIYLLSGTLKNANYNVETVDPYEFYQFENENDVTDACYEYLKSMISDEDIVCFSSNSFNWGLTRVISNKISENNLDQKIILGGLHPSIFDEHALKVTKATLVVRGEGEKKLIEVIDALISVKPLSDINGITYRKNDEIIRNPDEVDLTLKELEESAFPDFSTLPMNHQYDTIPIESSRGCKFSCAFCSIPNRYNWRGIGLEAVKRRASSALKYKHLFSPRSELMFVDDCFTADVERAKMIINGIKDSIGDMGMFIEVRASDVVNSDLFNRRNMDYDSVRQMQLGVECGYDEGLKKIRKGLTMDLLYRALTILCENGFRRSIRLSFIIGFPWEGIAEINKTMDTVEDIASRFRIVCNVNWLLLLPSDLWNERANYGITVDERLFDDPLWQNRACNFFKTHPLITEDIISQFEDRYGEMEKNRLPVFFFTPLYRRVKNLLTKNKEGKILAVDNLRFTE